ncbi:hypothetical protein Kpol_541p26 [Vanderwaltozyma polyspora DSM 70294]|uniref:SAP domain-containing protein n=1 Tax=Vanderwaltozyma polyspora (strain ATCC 22028 / DSM 70294 / BCRC 21397 / CBS 2163 / NBRC 10782 / NRRL Y-8283 / UCD 57-17) TaxID=436907 RepID=A7TIX1_VANPO|nr:uncharacterized protein Kpol_541p26 [Vanderwaltozyma polyspora DSM 70294]EDO17783.1 hypothetical protein Kpol_541p26 [Vanderwaltozyma polyspora DSM 70294]
MLIRLSLIITIFLGILPTIFADSVRSAFNYNVDKWNNEDFLEYITDNINLINGVVNNLHRNFEDNINLFDEDYLKDERIVDLSDWLFDTWSNSNIQNILVKSGIIDKSDKLNDSEKLIKLIKSNFDQICKALKVSKYYPSLDYFQNWTLKDIKLWLKRYNIEIDNSKINNRQDLVNLLRENIFVKTYEVNAKRQKIFQQLRSINEILFDSNGKLKRNILKQIPESDLQEWLWSHGIPTNDRNNLFEKVNANIELLKKDYQNYLDIKRENTNLYNLIPQWLQNGLHNVMSDQLYNINNWSKEKLGSYLEKNGIKHSDYDTLKKLQNLVMESINKIPSTINGWVQSHGEILQEKLFFLQREANLSREQLEDKFDEILNSKSTNELLTFLKKMGVEVNLNATKSQLISVIKDHIGEYWKNLN